MSNQEETGISEPEQALQETNIASLPAALREVLDQRRKTATQRGKRISMNNAH